MKVLVHDYSGHPFQVQLTRELARRGHKALHVYFSDFQTPRGDLEARATDPNSFDVRALSIGERFEKSTFLRRRAQEIAYGNRLANVIRDFNPDVVLSSNAPLDVQARALSAARHENARFVFWLQDIYGVAIRRFALKRWGPLGEVPGYFYQKLEKRLLRQSDEIVSISEDFVAVLRGYGVPPEHVHVVENWAPLSDIATEPKDNAWSRAAGYSGGRNVIYTGTLGYKHNPKALIELSRRVRANVLVFSEGPVADELRKLAEREGLDNLVVRNWVRFSDLPQVLGAADILVALIEPDAGIYSVPSKVLTYMAAGRPILAAVPEENLAARILRREHAGVVVAPGDVDAFCDNAQRMLTDNASARAMGDAGRRYAERAFDILTVADRFERILWPQVS